MILVLCHEADTSALWAADALKARKLAPMVLTGEDLAGVERWKHRVGAAAPDCEFSLSGGRRFVGRETRGVLNRLNCVPWAWQRRVGGPDRDYALQEMYAFYLSWLHALPGRKLNPPTPQGLCGNWRHPSVWAAMAARVGLPVQPFRQTSDDDPALPWRTTGASPTSTLHVIGAHVVGPATLVQSYREACLRLAAAAGAPLLGVDFSLDFAGVWRLTNVSIMPDLALGGEALADALAAELAP